MNTLEKAFKRMWPKVCLFVCFIHSFLVNKYLLRAYFGPDSWATAVNKRGKNSCPCGVFVVVTCFLLLIMKHFFRDVRCLISVFHLCEMYFY